MPQNPPAPGIRFVTLAKSGSSLVLTVSRDLLEQLELKRGDVLESWLEQRANGRLMLVFTRASSARSEK
jgi:antitoxin component of MazEF toxin-antitoxin module